MARDFYLNNYRGGRDATSVSADGVGVGLSNVPDFWGRDKSNVNWRLYRWVFTLGLLL